MELNYHSSQDSMPDISINAPAYARLTARWDRLYRLDHLRRIAGWDQNSNMPPKGQKARSAAITEVSAMMHSMLTARQLELDLASASDEPLAEGQLANLREMKRLWSEANAVPTALVEKKSMVNAACEFEWRKQRPLGDWKGLAVGLKEVVRLAREEAAYRSENTGRSRYETLMGIWEPGLTCNEVDRVFGEVRKWLPGLIEKVVEKQSREIVLRPQGPFDLKDQRALCEKVMGILGFDFEAGRLDVSTHPFCGGVPEDVRLTTRFSVDDFLKSLMATIHETGHGRYEQELPKELLGQPVGEPRSMAFHESQSLSFEMQVARAPGFVARLVPMLIDAFGNQPAFEVENMKRVMTRVEPGLIRCDADEVTYPAHVILRYEIERALIEGQAEVDDIPDLWNAKMKELLGVDTVGNFKDGPMQDVHWPVGLFGYFPCYSLGAMYAAQWSRAARLASPQIDVQVENGNPEGFFDWLNENIWKKASLFETNELSKLISGETLNPQHFRTHLERRYLGLMNS